jgi:RsiW-degrading membrane proteinase PrsW (M82 family)
MERKKDNKKNLWLKVLVTLLFLYGFSLLIFIATNDPIIFPTTLLLGSFMVPITYSAFFYERRSLGKLSRLRVITAFTYGGVLGVLAASILEPFVIRKLDFFTAFGIGLIEEFAKILSVVLIARGVKLKSELNGIILGAATGMGFAALESTGYAFTAFLASGGNLTDTVFVTLLRGLLSPVGHGMWTAILAGVMFREAKHNKLRLNLNVIEAYLGVSFLHGLWDGLPSLFTEIVLPGSDFFLAEAIVAITGFYLLAKLWKEAKKTN